MASILVIEDELVSQIYLSEFLRQSEHEVLTAENGEEGVRQFLENDPDLVLMDIYMPVMNGFEAARQIKQHTEGGRFIPIVFFTSAQDDKELAYCLECGGDDFISKPFNEIILTARVNAWLKRAQLTNWIAADRDLIEQILLRMRETKRFVSRGLRTVMTPLQKTTGDCVMSALCPDGSQMVLVGDFTGHGIAAAMLGPIVEEIFYNLCEDNGSLLKLLQEINGTLVQKSPANLFLTACILRLDPQQGRLDLWNGSMPPILLFRNRQQVNHFPSAGPPLGILPGWSFDKGIASCPVEKGDKIVIYSDGITELENHRGERFGQERFAELFSHAVQQGWSLDQISQSVESFHHGSGFQDDMTIVEVTVPPLSN